MALTLTHLVGAALIFAGVVAINRAGWVVWYYELKDEGMPGVPNAIGVFDFLPRAVVVLGSTLAGNSQIAQVSPLARRCRHRPGSHCPPHPRLPSQSALPAPLAPIRPHCAHVGYS